MREELKLYFDLQRVRSPTSRWSRRSRCRRSMRVDLRWIPFLLRIKGTGEAQSVLGVEGAVLLLDARRWANRRGGFPIKGPLKVYDSIAGADRRLFAQRAGIFRPYTEQVFARFFAASWRSIYPSRSRR